MAYRGLWRRQVVRDAGGVRASAGPRVGPPAGGRVRPSPLRASAPRAPRAAVTLVWALLGAGLLIASLAMPATAEAAPYPTVLTVVSVRGGQPDSVRPLTVTAEVANSGPAFAGWLEVLGAQRRVLVAVDVPAGSSRLSVAAYPVDYTDSVRVRLLDGSEKPVSEQRRAVLEYVTRALVVGAARAEVGDFLQSSEWLSVDREASLPDAGDLGRYEYVVLTGADPSVPDVGAARAAEALRLWVGRGGVLVVTESSALSEAATEGVLTAAFAAPRTLGQGSDLTIVDPVGFERMGSPPLAAGTVVVPLAVEEAPYSASLADGTVVLAGTVLGRGLVLFVGVSPAEEADDLDGSVRFFWENLVLWAPIRGQYTGSPWLDPPHLFVTGRVPPLVATGVGSVLYVVVVGIGSFVALRRLGRRDAVWWAVPAVVLATTFVVLGLGLALRGADQEVLVRRVLTLDPQGRLSTERITVGVYAPFGATFSAAAPEGLGPGEAGVYETGFDRPYTIRDAEAAGGGVGFEGVRVAPGAGRSVSFVGTVPGSPGAGDGGSPAGVPLRWSRSADGERVVWTVTNTGTAPLRHLLLAQNGVYTLPDLAPGASATFRVGSGPIEGEGVTPVGVEPARPRSRDYAEWEASLRLLGEWRQMGPWSEYDARGDAVIPAPPTAKGSGSAVEAAAAPVRLSAMADDPPAMPGLTGLSGGATVRGVTVYEVVLR